MCKTPVVLSLLTLFLLLSIATLLAAIFGHAWWIDSSQQRGGTFKQGILRNCHYYITMPKNCMFRENYFGFKKQIPQGKFLLNLTSYVVDTLTKCHDGGGMQNCVPLGVKPQRGTHIRHQFLYQFHYSKITCLFTEALDQGTNYGSQSIRNCAEV